MRRVQFSIHSRKRMHACHVNVYTEKRQKGGARACTCACACASLASKPTLNASRDRFRLRLHREKASSIHFSLFFFLLFLLFLFFFTFSFSDHLIQATTSSNLVIHFSFPDKRSLSILTFDEFRRDTDVANGNRFKQGTRIALFFYIGERGNKTKKGKSFERRAGRQILLLKKCECKRKFKLMNIFV